ncbi:MAG: AzlD domain-containing protein [Cellulosilyticaceae bacterium]
MNNLWLSIGIMALVTYFIRVFPLLLMKKQIKSRFWKSFLYYIPYAVLAAMTFPAIIYSTGSRLTGVIGAIIGITLAYFGKSLLQTSLITVVVVYLINLI